MNNSPWANVPKMSRAEAAEWKKDKRNRRERYRKYLADQEAMKTMVSKKKKPRTETYVVRNEKEMAEVIDRLMNWNKGK